MSNGRRPWSQEDDNRLKELWASIPKGLICAALCRSYASIAIQASRLGLSNRYKGGGRPKGSKHLVCRHGHPLTDDNVYIHSDSRQCKICNLAHARRAREKKKAAA